MTNMHRRDVLKLLSSIPFVGLLFRPTVVQASKLPPVLPETMPCDACGEPVKLGNRGQFVITRDIVTVEGPTHLLYAPGAIRYWHLGCDKTGQDRIGA